MSLRNGSPVVRHFGYAGAQYSDVIHQFEINKYTGAVVPLETPNVTAATLPFNLAAQFQGKFVVSANYSAHSIGSYSVNQRSGELTWNQDLMLANNASPGWVVAHPLLNIFYSANPNTNTISTLSLDPTTGHLNESSVLAAGAGVTSLVLNKSGSVLYSADQGANQIGIYTVSPLGDLSLASTISRGAGTQVSHLILSPDGKFLYAGNWGTGTVAGYRVSGTTLTSVGADVSSGAGGVYTVSISPNGKFLYAAKPYGNSYAVHALDSVTGAIGVAVTTALAGVANFSFFGDFVFTVPWTSAAGGLPIETRRYDDATGITSNALSSSAPLRGLYQLLILDIVQ